MDTYQAHAYHRSSDFPENVWDALLENEGPANVVLPYAEKARSSPHDGDRWVVVYDGADNVELVLSSTKGPVGNYPIFVVPSKSSTKRIEEEGDNYLASALPPLVDRLLQEVPLQRIFAIFSNAKVSAKFAELFVAAAHARGEHGIQAHAQPYYDATYTFCTPSTFNEAGAFQYRGGEGAMIAIRPAKMSHLQGVKALCQEFSMTSPPYILDDARAELEAKTMIEKQQVWVYTVQEGDQAPEVACLVAVTRESSNIMAVTKVITAGRYMRRGCAGALLHRFCQEVLKGKPKKERIVLYVGNSPTMKGARDLYHKIGFQGLGDAKAKRVEGVEHWVEIGFTGTDLGFW